METNFPGPMKVYNQGRPTEKQEFSSLCKYLGDKKVGHSGYLF